MKQTVFKIRNKETGQFSKGGTYSVWSRTGKAWGNIGHVKNHLNQFIYNGKLRPDYPYHNAEIVEVEIDYDGCFSYSVDEMISKMQESKAEQEKAYAEQQRKWKEKRERQLLQDLLGKYPDEGGQ